MFSVGSTISTVAKEVYIKEVMYVYIYNKYKNLKLKTEFEVRSSRCEHPALTSPTHFRCGPCWRYISMSTLILHPFLNICLFQISNGLPHMDVYVDIF